jgi:uridine kinase
VTQRPLVITLSGPSGSGKTTFVHELIDALRAPVALVYTDDYYIGKTRMRTEMPRGEEVNFDHPASINLATLVRDITALQANCPVSSPIYDMAVSEPTGNTRIIEPAGVIMVEGIAANLDQIRYLSDISICVTAPLEERIRRCLARDNTRNLREEHEVIAHFTHVVAPSYDAYFKHADEQADYTIQH